jgi:hypothetical protein
MLANHSRIHKGKTIMTISASSKCVLVHRYRRFRFGRWEDVCQHLRSLPR